MKKLIEKEINSFPIIDPVWNGVEVENKKEINEQQRFLQKMKRELNETDEISFLNKYQSAFAFFNGIIIRKKVSSIKAMVVFFTIITILSLILAVFNNLNVVILIFGLLLLIAPQYFYNSQLYIW